MVEMAGARAASGLATEVRMVEEVTVAVVTEVTVAGVTVVAVTVGDVVQSLSARVVRQLGAKEALTEHTQDQRGVGEVRAVAAFVSQHIWLVPVKSGFQ